MHSLHSYSINQSINQSNQSINQSINQISHVQGTYTDHYNAKYSTYHWSFCNLSCNIWNSQLLEIRFYSIYNTFKCNQLTPPLSCIQWLPAPQIRSIRDGTDATVPSQCLRGRRHLSPAELSKCYTRAAFQLFNLSSMGSHRDLSLAPYCLSCIRQKSTESLLSMGSSSISMPTTAKFRSPRQ